MNKTQKLVQSIEESMGATFSIFTRGIIGRFAYGISKLACRTKDKSMKSLVEWVDDQSRKTGVSSSQLYLCQYLYDIAQFSAAMSNDYIPSACTVAASKGMFLRYMDWSIPDDIGKYAYIEKKSSDGIAYKDVSFPGFFGCLTAVGNNWAMAMNQMPSWLVDIHGIPTTIFSKEITLQMAKRIEQGVEITTAASQAKNYMKENNLLPISSVAVFFYSAYQDTNVVIQYHPSSSGGEWSTDFGVKALANQFVKGSTFRKKHRLKRDTNSQERIDQAANIIGTAKDYEDLIAIATNSEYPCNNSATAYIVAADINNKQITLIS